MVCTFAFCKLTCSTKEDKRTAHPGDDEAAFGQTEEHTGETSPAADSTSPAGMELAPAHILVAVVSAQCEAAAPTPKGTTGVGNFATDEDSALFFAKAIVIAANMNMPSFCKFAKTVRCVSVWITCLRL
jgi:hypothetical protein